MALNYSEQVILMSYRHEDPKDYSPSAEVLRQWDLEKFQQYDVKLVDALQKVGIAISRENKSRLLMYALLSNGQSPGVKVNNGLRYFEHVAGLNIA